MKPNCVLIIELKNKQMTTKEKKELMEVIDNFMSPATCRQRKKE